MEKTNSSIKKNNSKTNFRLGAIGWALGSTSGIYLMAQVSSPFADQIELNAKEYTKVEKYLTNTVISNSTPTQKQLVETQYKFKQLTELPNMSNAASAGLDELIDKIDTVSNLYTPGNIQEQNYVNSVLVNTRDEFMNLKDSDYLIGTGVLWGTIVLGSALFLICGYNLVTKLLTED